MSIVKPTRFLILLCLFVLLPVVSFAQSSNGSISGNVTDASGGALPGVSITVTNIATHATRVTVTNGSGHFELPLLPPGTYTVSGELSGFQAMRYEKVTVNVGTDTGLTLKMKPGVSDILTVTASAPLVETTRSEVSSVVNDKAIQNLPVNGRNFLDFVLTTPGVVRDPRGGDISFAGQKGTLNSVIVDGADNNNTFFGQSLGRTGVRAPYQFSQDAVKEFQVNTNAYSAEFGRAGGAVINVITKSGTNDFQGSLFDFYRDKKYRSNDYLNQLRNLPKSPYHFDQYGASFGGPIVQDKHFFFVNYDAQRNSIPNATSLGISGVPSNVAAADVPAAQAALQFLSTKALAYSQKQNQDVVLLKTDHELPGSNHLALRYNRQNFTGANFENGGLQSAAEHTGDSLIHTTTLSGVGTTIFNNTLFNEVRGQYAKDQEPGRANSDDPEATIRQGGATVLVIGRNSFSPRETTIHRSQIADTVTYLLSTHTVKAGFDYNRDKIFNFFPGNFSGVYTFNSLADFTNKKPATYLQNFAGVGTTGGTTNPNLTDQSLFAEDQWQVMPTFTLNLGLRYDRQVIAQPSVRNPDPQLLAAGLDTSRIHQDKNNIAPRLGFAWTPGGDARTVVRGGYGVFYGRTPAIMVGTGHSQNGIQVQSINFPVALMPVYPGRYDSLPAALASLPQNIFVFAPDFQNPRVNQSSIGVERALTNDLSLGVTYQYVTGSSLPRTVDANVGVSTVVTTPLFDVNNVQIGTVDHKVYSNGGRPFSSFNRVLEAESNGRSKYNGLTLDLNKRYSDNFQARIAYTYSKAKDNRPDATIVVAGVDDGREVQDANNIGDDYSFGDSDVRNRVVLSGVWNLRYFDAMQSATAHALLSGWSFAAIAAYQSGQPYTPIINGDFNNDRNRSNDRAPGFARNSLRLPSQFSIDPRLTRDIHVFANTHLQLIAEAFNITNRSNVSRVRNTYASYSGAATNKLTLGAVNPINGYQSASATTGPRTYQFAAKLLF